MADEIKQTGRVGGILPLKPTRDDLKQRRVGNERSNAQQRKKRRQDDDGPAHHVDEYV